MNDKTIRTAAEIALEMAGQEELEDLPNAETTPPSPAGAHEDETFREKYLRTRADLENIQRRQREEREQMRLNAIVGLIRELLPVFDTLDRALLAAAQDTSDLATGLRMTRQQLDQVLQHNHVSLIDNSGPFNPDWHEAVTSVLDPTVPENTIRAVIEPGYVLGDRVIRYSKVQVTTGAPPVAEKTE